MYAKVTFTVEHKENVLVVPANAIVDASGQEGRVLPGDGDVAKFQPVTLGMSDPDAGRNRIGRVGRHAGHLDGRGGAARRRPDRAPRARPARAAAAGGGGRGGANGGRARPVAVGDGQGGGGRRGARAERAVASA